MASATSRHQKLQPLRSPDPVADAERYLARSDRSVEQVRVHLSRRGYSAREIRTALNTLHRYGYLGDAAVAQRLAHSYVVRRPVGAQALREVLKQRGFDNESAERAAREAYEGRTEQEVAARFLSTLPVKFKDPMRESHRRARLLVARAFPQDVIDALLGPRLDDHNL